MWTEESEGADDQVSKNPQTVDPDFHPAWQPLHAAFAPPPIIPIFGPVFPEVRQQESTQQLSLLERMGGH